MTQACNMAMVVNIKVLMNPKNLTGFIVTILGCTACEEKQLA